MKLDQNTTQAELQKLYKAIVNKEFLKGTPLNLKFFLRYLILFLLFPAMILGYWVGFIITGIFCLLLIVLLSLGYVAAATIAVYTWFCLGMLPICYVTWKTYSKAARIKKMRMMLRETLDANPAKACVPKNMPLKWNSLRRKHNTRMVTSVVINAPQTGIYVLLLTIPHYNGDRLLTDGPAGMCIMQSKAQKGGKLSALLLYNLKAGAHEINWTLVCPEETPAPESYLTMINV